MNQKAEFDQFAKNYQDIHKKNIRISGFDPSYFDEMKLQKLQKFFNSKSNQELHFLNFGCGIGKSDPYIRTYFPNAIIHSVDTSEDSLKEAKLANQTLTNCTYYHYKPGNPLPFTDKIDIVIIANVLHHIPRDEHDTTIQYITNQLNPEGCISIFEHNPFNPLTQVAVKTCEFDGDAVLLSPRYAKKLLRKNGLAKQTLHFIIFLPGFLKKFLKLEDSLTWCPLGAQYMLIGQN